MIQDLNIGGPRSQFKYICLNFATPLNTSPLLRLLMWQNAQKTGIISCLDDLMGAIYCVTLIVIIFNFDVERQNNIVLENHTRRENLKFMNLPMYCGEH